MTDQISIRHLSQVLRVLRFGFDSSLVQAHWGHVYSLATHRNVSNSYLQLVIFPLPHLCRGTETTASSDTTSSLSSCPGTLTTLRLRTVSELRSNCSSSTTTLRTAGSLPRWPMLIAFNTLPSSAGT